MDAKTRKQYELRARVIKALAHPTRLFITETLVDGPRCVCELTEMVGADISTVSRHLALLRNAGLLEDERRGNQVFYHLKTPCITRFFQCVESVVEESKEETILIA